MGFNSHLRGIPCLAAITLLSIALGGIGGAAAEPYRIVGFGDSLMAGYELAPGESFPEQLEARLRDLGHEVTVVNAGVSGDTTSGGLARLDWSVDDETSLVILELGANDALRGVAPEIVQRNLAEMISRLREREIEVVIAGMLSPPNMGDEYAAEFNAIYPELAKEHDVRLLPFFLEGVAAESRLLLADGMHPNEKGVSRMVDNILPLVLEVMEPAPGTE